MVNDGGLQPVIRKLLRTRVLSTALVLGLWVLVTAIACSDSDNQVAVPPALESSLNPVH